MKRSDAMFLTCVECGSNRPNHSGLCPTCEQQYDVLTGCDCKVCRSDLAGITPCEKDEK